MDKLFFRSFEGNVNIDDVKITNFDPPFIARVFRIHSITYYLVPVFRFDAFYEDLEEYEESTEIVGAIESGGNVEVSSYYPEFDCAFKFGYHLNQNRDLSIDGWRAKFNDQSQWIQISSSFRRVWERVETQGRHFPDYACSGCNEYVTSYLIQYSSNGIDWTNYNDGEELVGNSDTDSIVSNYFSPCIVAQSIRIMPIAYNEHIAMRAEGYYFTSLSTVFDFSKNDWISNKGTPIDFSLEGNLYD